MSKLELIFIFPLLQPSFEAVQGINWYSVIIQAVSPYNYPFTEKMLSQVGAESYFL